MPNLLKGAPTIVTDQEIQSNIPNAIVSCCWNHLRTDITFWVKKHGGNGDHIAVYCGDLDRLLRANSPREFDDLYAIASVRWSQAFKDHFDKSIKNASKSAACKYILEQYNLYDEYFGLTNNISEGFRTVGIPLSSTISCI